MGSKPSKTIPPGSPLGQLLESLKPHALIPSIKMDKLVRLCSKTWPRHKLEGNLRWPLQGLFDPDVLRELANFCHRSTKWKELMYIMGFFYMALKTDPSTVSHCSPAHMFLALSSQDPPSQQVLSSLATAMDPADEPPPPRPRGTAPSRPPRPHDILPAPLPSTDPKSSPRAPRSNISRSSSRSPPMRRHFNISACRSPSRSPSPHRHFPRSRSLSPRSFRCFRSRRRTGSLSSSNPPSPHSSRRRNCTHERLTVSFGHRQQEGLSDSSQSPSPPAGPSSSRRKPPSGTKSTRSLAPTFTPPLTRSQRGLTQVKLSQLQFCP
ncbi:serine/arginine repetitive matrix protein 1-like [Alexandromys fortis]|uniref:serine/arginine repetitive matrix protein 1-like n=1 Tax=Alexandromys fortis TaxID=100897 RepID=UPI00215291B9|nr:serine/arginine repetitive matrix protein 1-like [Microtus fortis]